MGGSAEPGLERLAMRRRLATAPQLAALAAALTYIAIATIGITRSYQYDEGVTISLFIRPRGFVDAVTAQRVFNNHPLLTATDWLVYRLGGTTEAWLRVAPIAAGAATVAIVAWWCARRWGVASALVATALIVVNPLYLDLTRQVRGYSFAVFGVVVGSLLVADRRRRLDDPRWRAMYALVVAACLLSHLYTVLALIGHGAHIWRNRRSHLWSWIGASVLGGLVAAPIYAVNVVEMIGTTRSVRPFHLFFPIDVGDQLFGGRLLGVVGLVVLALLLINNRPHVLPFTIAVVATTSVLWLVVRPVMFVPRFFVWLVPLFALLAARSVHRRRLAAVPLLTFAALLIPGAASVLGWSASVRDVARAALELEASGEEVCTADYYWEEYYVYADFPQVSRAGEDCSLTIVRRSDLDNPHVRGLETARIEDVDDVCFAAEATTLRRTGLEPNSCAPDG